MEHSLRELVFMGLSVIAATLLILLSLPMAQMAREANNEYTATKTELAAMAAGREWRKYTGEVSGAAMVGFVIRHKYSCDIVIRNTSWDARIIPYLSGGELYLGLSDTNDIPDYFWDTAFLFDVLLNGHGERRYFASLTYNYDTIVGIHYEEV